LLSRKFIIKEIHNRDIGTSMITQPYIHTYCNFLLCYTVKTMGYQYKTGIESSDLIWFIIYTQTSQRCCSSLARVYITNRNKQTKEIHAPKRCYNENQLFNKYKNKLSEKSLAITISSERASHHSVTLDWKCLWVKDSQHWTGWAKNAVVLVCSSAWLIQLRLAFNLISVKTKIIIWWNFKP